MNREEAKPSKKTLFGQLLHFHRVNNRFKTQPEFAEAAEIGSDSTVSRAENGTVGEDAARDLIAALHAKRPLSWPEKQDLATAFLFPDEVAHEDGRSNVIGLVVTTLGPLPFWSLFVAAAERAAMQHGYILAIGQHRSDLAMQREVITALTRDRLLAGLLIAPAYGIREAHHYERTTADVLLALEEQLVPVVLIDRKPSFPTPFPCVRASHEYMARAAVGELVKRGHRRIGAIFGARHSPAYEEQYQGFVDALRECNAFDSESELKHWLNQWVAFENPSQARLSHERNRPGYSSGRDTAMHLLSQPGVRPTALVCGTAALAQETLVAVRNLARDGLRLSVPEDVSIIAAETAPFLDWAVPPITSIAYDHETFAWRAVEKLIALIEHPERKEERQDDDPVREFTITSGSRSGTLRETIEHLIAMRAWLRQISEAMALPHRLPFQRKT